MDEEKSYKFRCWVSDLDSHARALRVITIIDRLEKDGREVPGSQYWRNRKQELEAKWPLLLKPMGD